MLTALLVLTGSASAGSEVWAGLYNGRLVASVERAPEEAANVYEVLLEDLTAQEAHLRNDLLLGLGQARFEAGDVDGAIEALSEADSPKAAALLSLIRTWSAPVTALPYQSRGEITLTGTSAWQLMLDGVDPESIALRLQTDEGAALLQLTVTDLEGRRWGKELLELAGDDWQEVTIKLANLRPVAGTTGTPRGDLWMVSITPAAPLQGTLRIDEVVLR